MTLILLIAIPLAAGIVASLPTRRRNWPAGVSLAALAAELVLAGSLWTADAGTGRGQWLAEFNAPWLPGLGVGFHIALDGISLLMILLSSVLGMMAVACSWTEIRERRGFFHFNLLWCLSGIIAVFMAMDLFLFYFFWELMLVPMYFLIALWGHEKRGYAAMKFFIFTQLSGLLMLASILGLYFAHAASTGLYTFDYIQLLGTPLGAKAAFFLMAGFVIAFLVKLPAIPFHTWLADAHTEAPTAGSVILAGLLLKTGAYGLLRFAVPLFPSAFSSATALFMILAVAGILYGAVLSFGQTDLKRLVAYTSVSHMGFVLLGISVWNELALQGVVVQMISHGISTGALFMIAGALQERTGTRELSRLGGLWSTAPRMGGAGLLFAAASLGLPGLGNFIGEFLILLGTYRASPLAAAAGSLGLIVSTVYAVWLVQRIFLGENRESWKIPDLNARETAAMGVLAVLIVLLGLYPQPTLNLSSHGLENLSSHRPYGLRAPGKLLIEPAMPAKPGKKVLL